MRVLLIESEPEDVLFLRDVLLEMGESRFWNTWVNIEILHADSWSNASTLLSSEPLDLVLLDLDISDSQGIETFRLAQHAAPHIPMLLLLGGAEESLGVRLVREGAQDFLVKKDVDCAPLAHAMQTAIERHRLLTAARAASARDTLTGLLNRSAFLTAADRDRKLAERLGRRLMLVVAEPNRLVEIATPYGRQRQDLSLVETADHLRRVAGPVNLLGRIETTLFAITIFDSESDVLEAAWARFQTSLLPQHIHLGAAVFSPSHPSTLDTLLEQAIRDLSPNALAMRT
jgi:PleD family two-component response regulator